MLYTPFWSGLFKSGTSVKVVHPDIPLSQNSTPNPEQVASVVICIKILGDFLSKMPIEVYKMGPNGKEKAKDHSLYEKLKFAPNGYQTAQVFASTLETTRGFQGNAMARIYRKAGNVDRFEILMPGQITDYKLKQGELYFKIDGKWVNSSEVLHFKGLSRDGIWGMNPIEVLRSNINVSGKAIATLDNFYSNNAHTRLAIKSTAAAGNQKAKGEAVKKFAEKHSGSLNAGKLITLPTNTELQEMSMNLKDAEFLGSIKANAGFITGLYGVPLHWVTGEGGKYANLEQDLGSFRVNTMSAITQHYRKELEFKLLTSKERIEGYSIEFNDKALMATDFAGRIAGYVQLYQNGLVDGDYITDTENLPRTPHGKKYYYQVSNMKPVQNEGAE